MERFFKLKEHGTTVKTEIIAGLTTFFAMAYIIFVNPSYLSQAGMDYTSVLVATCVSAAIGSFLTAFMANVPFAQAPGMGLNAFFTFSVCFGMGYTWQQALTIVMISGVLFLAIAVSPIRSKIISSIPAPLSRATSFSPSPARRRTARPTLPRQWRAARSAPCASVRRRRTFPAFLCRMCTKRLHFARRYGMVLRREN